MRGLIIDYHHLVLSLYCVSVPTRVFGWRCWRLFVQVRKAACEFPPPSICAFIGRVSRWVCRMAYSYFDLFLGAVMASKLVLYYVLFINSRVDFTFSPLDIDNGITLRRCCCCFVWQCIYFGELEMLTGPIRYKKYRWSSEWLAFEQPWTCPWYPLENNKSNRITFLACFALRNAWTRVPIEANTCPDNQAADN